MVAAVVLTIVTRVTILGGNPGGFLLLPTVYIAVAGLLVMHWDLRSGGLGAADERSREALNRKITGIVCMALMGISVACCAGASSLGGFHRHASGSAALTVFGR